MSTPEPRPDGDGGWTVACLCAAWCQVCEAFRPHFAARAAAETGVAHRWIDIEDDADAIGDLDIETFPTLLVLRDGVPLFYGPVLPQPAAIDALLDALRRDPVPRARAEGELAPLLGWLARG